MADFDNNYFKKRIGKLFSDVQALEQELMSEMRIELSDKPHTNWAQNHLGEITEGIMKLDRTVAKA